MRWRKYKKTVNALVLFGFVLLSVLVYQLVRKMDYVYISGTVYQYEEKEKKEYTGNNQFYLGNEGVELTNETTQVVLKDVPLYDSTGSKVLLTSTMSLVQPKLYLTNRVNPLTIIYKRNRDIVLEYDGIEKEMNDFFLYDGKDSYLFFEKAVLNWNGKIVSLDSFSFVTVQYGESITYYNPKLQEYITETCTDTNISITLESGYQINLSTDILYRDDGFEQMLFARPDLLEELQ